MTAPSAPVAISLERPAQAAYLEHVRLAPKRRLRSIDAEYRGKRYRIEETIREQGASVRASGALLICTGCLKAIGPTTKRLVVGPDLRPHCLGCAISVGLLVRLSIDLIAEAIQRAFDEGIAWA